MMCIAYINYLMILKSEVAHVIKIVESIWTCSH